VAEDDLESIGERKASVWGWLEKGVGSVAWLELSGSAGGGEIRLGKSSETPSAVCPIRADWPSAGSQPQQQQQNRRMEKESDFWSTGESERVGWRTEARSAPTDSSH